MRRISSISILVAVVLAACGGATPPVAPAPAAKPFAMRGYIVVLLKRGPAWSPDETPESKRLFEGHMANIKAMGDSGKLVLAGPFDADAARTDAYAGLFVFDATAPAEVEALLRGDPAVVGGRLVPEIYPWYGPSGLTYDGKTTTVQVAP